MQDAQKLRLKLDGHLGYLVEQQRAALGVLYESVLVGVRARESALRVAEQLRLDQFFGERGAVDLDEGLLVAERVVVDGVGDEFLARARLADDEDVCVRLRDRLDGLVDLLHLARRADDVEVLGARRELAAH